MELATKKVELEEKIKVLESEKDELNKAILELEEKILINDLEAKAAELQTELEGLKEKKKQLEGRMILPEIAVPTPPQN